MNQIINETGYKGYPNLTVETILNPIISDMKTNCKSFEPKATALDFYGELENVYGLSGYTFNFTYNGQEYQFIIIDFKGFIEDF
jgi:hypothetical protein